MADSRFPYDLTVLGGRLRELRERNGLSRRALEIKTGIKEATIGSYETGKRAPEWETIADLAKELGTTSEALLEGLPSSKGARDGQGAPPDERWDELFERVLRVCELTEKAQRHEVAIQRHRIPAPFGQMAEVRFRARLLHSMSESVYALVALPTEVETNALDALCAELRARDLRWATLVYKGARGADRVEPREGISIRVVSLEQLEEELIDLRPYVKWQTARLALEARSSPAPLITPSVCGTSRRGLVATRSRGIPLPF